jgi:hypothetical protein
MNSTRESAPRAVDEDAWFELARDCAGNAGK